MAALTIPAEYIALDLEEWPYGDYAAGIYDDLYGESDEGWAEDTLLAVSFLSQMCNEGPILELGVGTGRVAVPLALRGVKVHGIDTSKSMLDVLRSKEGGQLVTTHIGDFGKLFLGTRFAMIFSVFDSFRALLTEDRQKQALDHIVQHLKPDARLVLEMGVTRIQEFEDKQRIKVQKLGEKYALVALSRLEPTESIVSTQQILLSEDGIRLIPSRYSVLSPRKLDTLATQAGLRLESRYCNWAGEQFTPESRRHVSVYS